MSRNDKMLAGLNLDEASGIEIGALDKPIVPPSSPRIFYVDHLGTADLRVKYRHDPSIDVDRIVDVGGIWGSNTLVEAAASVAPVDFIIASHVIEHVPDLVGWLHELATALTKDGEVRLAIPDRRHTFDYLRRETQVAEALEAHLLKARMPRPRCILDCLLLTRVVDCARSWETTLAASELSAHYTFEAAVAVATDAIQHDTYHDVHCWVFTPEAFARLMLQLAEGAYLPFACAELLDTEHYSMEFFCRLKRASDSEQIIESWRQAVRQFEQPASADELAPKSGLAAVAAAAAEQAEVLALRVRQLEARNRQFESSRSWRYTSPLRALEQWGRDFDRWRRHRSGSAAN